MGDRAKGRDKGTVKKKAKAAKPGLRPHEQQPRTVSDLLKRDSSSRAEGARAAPGCRLSR